VQRKIFPSKNYETSEKKRTVRSLCVLKFRTKNFSLLWHYFEKQMGKNDFMFACPKHPSLPFSNWFLFSPKIRKNLFHSEKMGVLIFLFLKLSNPHKSATNSVFGRTVFIIDSLILLWENLIHALFTFWMQ
jgi:hypothetical protein